MTTKNHKPATTSDILSNAPGLESNNPSSIASAKEVRHSFSSTRARCGKVGRLPKEIRDQINEMLLDGIPHAQIIQTLRDNFGASSTAPDSADIPAGPQSNVLPLDPESSSSSDHSSHLSHTSHPAPSIGHPASDPSSIENQKSKIKNLDLLTPRHITNWKKFGGYRDWLKDQHRLEECKLRHELTLDLARSAEGLASYQAAPKVAVAQICQTIIDLGPDGLKESLQGSPLNCFRLLNALARLINSGLKCEQQIQKTATATTKQRGAMTRARFARIEKNMNLM